MISIDNAEIELILGEIILRGFLWLEFELRSDELAHEIEALGLPVGEGHIDSALLLNVDNVGPLFLVGRFWGHKHGCQLDYGGGLQVEHRLCFLHYCLQSRLLGERMHLL